MSAPGTTGKCPRCGAMVRWATLASTGQSVAVEPIRQDCLLGYGADEPYRNVQSVSVLVPHAQRCGKRRAA